MISYPAIPLPSATPTGSAATPVVRTDLPQGLVEQEGRYSAILKTFNLTWRMTSAEFAIFEEWFSDVLFGGVLTFALDFALDGVEGDKPVRFVNGTYGSTRDGGGNYNVTAVVECLTVGPAAANRTLPVPSWYRVALDPVIDQVLTLAHRNSLLTSRPDDESIRTLRVFPPTDPTAYIYFGIQNFGDGDTLITSEEVDPLPVLPTPAFPGLPRVNIGMADNGNRVVSRLEMDGGHPRQWVEFDTTTKVYQVTWEFSAAQLQTFETFFYTTLKGGSRVFTMVLPVSGIFASVPVRFIGGEYSMEYVPVNRFRVSASLDRQVAQTETPPEWRPYGLYYGPVVNVTANRKVTAGDAMKMFIVNPAEGQTINLHIYALDIEFGLLKIGPGQVLITRGPFILDVGEVGPETAESSFFPPGFLSLGPVIVPIGEIASESAESGFDFRPVLDLQSVIVPLGSIKTETAQGTFAPPSYLDLRETLVPVGSIKTETAAASFTKPTTFIGP